MLSVKYIQNTPFAFSYGGFEIQTKLTLEAVKSVGSHADYLDVYSQNSDFDVIHLWGVSHHSAKLAQLAKKAGKKVVVTALLSYFETPVDKIRYEVLNLVKKYEYLKSFNRYADAFVVMNEEQRQVAIRYCKIDPNKIKVIPNIVEQVFFENNEGLDGNYVICSGNICKRKNQLILMEACIRSKTPLVLLGHVLDGESDYADKIERLIKQNPQLIQWVRGLRHASDEMTDLYKRAKLMVLPSLSEIQPISLLEGAAIGLPLVTSDVAFGKQIYYKNAKLVNPGSVQSVMDGILAVWQNPEAYKTPIAILKDCQKENVGRAYQVLYNQL